jgi:protein-tyrosine phosphatase
MHAFTHFLLSQYEEPGLLKMYEEAGIRWHRQPMGNEKAATNIMKLLQDCKEQDEKVVVHCTHGMGRSGRVAAGWLVTFYGLSPEAATQEVMEYAEKHGIQRLGSVRQLVNWLKV